MHVITFTPTMLSKVVSRSFHASRLSAHKVAVLGAAGGIGQPMSLLLKDVREGPRPSPSSPLPQPPDRQPTLRHQPSLLLPAD